MYARVASGERFLKIIWTREREREKEIIFKNVPSLESPFAASVCEVYEACVSIRV